MAEQLALDFLHDIGPIHVRFHVMRQIVWILIRFDPFHTVLDDVAFHLFLPLRTEQMPDEKLICTRCEAFLLERIRRKLLFSPLFETDRLPRGIDHRDARELIGGTHREVDENDCSGADTDTDEIVQLKVLDDGDETIADAREGGELVSVLELFCALVLTGQLYVVDGKLVEKLNVVFVVEESLEGRLIQSDVVDCD